VASLAAGRLLRPELAGAISLAIVLAIASSINATVLGASRIYYAMAEDNIFWSSLKKLHPRYGTPYVAIFSQSLLAAAMVTIGTFDQLLGYVVFFMLATSIMSGGAHLILRRQRPRQERPYRTWGYPFVPLIFIAAYGWIALQICLDKPWTSLIGLLIAATGLPFYLFWTKGKRPLSVRKEMLPEEVLIDVPPPEERN
jgi:APA family basic amino acid/polyamine antiporter